MRFLAFVGVVGLTGCLKGEAPISARTVEASATSYTVEVKTLPGLEVDVSGQKGTAGDDGIARVTLTVASLYYAKNTNDLSVMARGRKGLTKYFGSSRVTLPFTPEVAEKLPQSGPWLRVLSGKNGVSGGSGWFFGPLVGGGLLAPDGSPTLEVLAPPNAKVELAGKSATANELGAAELAFTPAEVFSMASLGSGDETVEASVNGERLGLAAHWSLSAAQVRPYFEKPTGGERSAETLALYFQGDGLMYGGGRDGKLATADVVGTGTEQPSRKVSPCSGYHLLKAGEKPSGAGVTLDRVAIDEEVVARDAHTGKELGRKVFAAQDFCPIELPRGKDVLENRVDSKVVTAWLATL